MGKIKRISKGQRKGFATSRFSRVAAIELSRLSNVGKQGTLPPNKTNNKERGKGKGYNRDSKHGRQKRARKRVKRRRKGAITWQGFKV